MSKETFYFPHDYNARTDRKLINVIMKYGMAGIGAYWCMIEMLYEEGGYMPIEYERISFELRIEKNVIQSLINDFDLFLIDDDKFYSESVISRLKERCEKSEKARESINKRWDKYERITNVLQPNDKRNTIKEKKGKEKKGKEKNKKEMPTHANDANTDTSKDTNTDKGTDTGKDKKIPKKTFIPPTINDVKKFFKENGYLESYGESRWHYYNDADWKDSEGKPVLSWKQKMRGVWFKEDHKAIITGPKQPVV